MSIMRCADLMARIALIYFPLGFVLPILDEVIHQPCIHYQSTDVWISDRVPVCAGFGAVVGLVVALLIPFDLSHQRARRAVPLDIAYYPTLRGLRRCCSETAARMFLIVGLILLGGWIAHRQLDLILQSMPPVDNVHPPPWIIPAGLVAWGILWLADCLARPKLGTHVAAMGFLSLAVFLAWTMEQMGTLRE